MKVILSWRLRVRNALRSNLPSCEVDPLASNSWYKQCTFWLLLGFLFLFFARQETAAALWQHRQMEGSGVPECNGIWCSLTAMAVQIQLS